MNIFYEHDRYKTNEMYGKNKTYVLKGVMMNKNILFDYYI